jgi:hypothetical protein
MSFFSISSLKNPKRIVRTILSIPEYLYVRFLCRKPKLNDNFVCTRYLVADQEALDFVARSYGELFPDRIKLKISEADKIREHIFDLLGSGPIKLSLQGEGYQPINWNIDFKSGHRWNPKTFYSHIQYGQKEGVDIKVPWELSRFQHMNILGQAYLLTKDKKYAEEFRDQIADWIDNNPIGFGVNWKCTMDVAIRVANWLISQEYFSGSEHITKDFWHKFYTSIYEHGKFIINHLENKSLIRNNHYISDLVGLFFIATYCPFFKESKRWGDFAIKELSQEIDIQIYPDGCNFEASTSYHRLVLELLFYITLLAERSGSPLPNKFKDKVEKMFEFCLFAIKPDGTIPQIGDNDSGRFLVFCKRPVLDHKYLLSFASIAYEDSQFKISDFGFDEEVFWTFGRKGKKLYDNLPPRTGPLNSKAFPDAGWYIIRNSNDYCLVSCGPNGQSGKGGHAHNDKLSFELVLDGRNIVVDPGTYIYTSYPEIRNLFRSTEYHNTIKFGDYEQNDNSEQDLFLLPDRIEIKRTSLKENTSKIFFKGEIKYQDIIHERTINFDIKSRNWHIADKFSSNTPLNGKLLFHLSPDLTTNGKEILDTKTCERSVAIDISENNIEKKEYDYSPEYGKKVKADCLVVNIAESTKSHEIHTHIRKT